MKWIWFLQLGSFGLTLALLKQALIKLSGKIEFKLVYNHQYDK